MHPGRFVSSIPVQKHEPTAKTGSLLSLIRFATKCTETKVNFSAYDYYHFD